MLYRCLWTQIGVCPSKMNATIVTVILPKPLGGHTEATLSWGARRPLRDRSACEGACHVNPVGWAGDTVQRHCEIPTF